MKCNVGSTDRLLRIIAGLVVLILGVVFKSWWGLLGVVFLATGLLRYCPFYPILKMDTTKKEN
jgi:hypothetical protein